MTKQRIGIHFATIASICFCAPFAAADIDTAWQGTPGIAKDWFDPANWSNGVPNGQNLDAVIDNDGTAHIGSGSAASPSIAIGRDHSGGLVLDAGLLETTYWLYLGYSKESHGSLEVNGGTLKSQTVNVGLAYGFGSIAQNGGVVDVQYMELGGNGNFFSQYGRPEDFGKGDYHLIGGQLDVTQLKVGNSGVGTFRQDGGIVSIEAQLSVGGAVGAQSEPVWYGYDPPLLPAVPPILVTNNASPTIQQTSATTSLAIADVWYPPPTPSVGMYELAGGSLTSHDLRVAPTGTFRQTGGSHQVGFINVNSGGRYELLGGTLQIASGLQVDGTFDFGHSSSNLAAGNVILDLSQGITGAEHAHITAGPESLTIFAPGFRPRRDLESYESQGLTHIAGSDLILRAGQRFRGWGTINDHVVAAGTIIAGGDADNGGIAGITLNDGLELEPGANVDLAAGMINVKDRRTSIAGGTLKALGINVVGGIQQPSPALLMDPPVYFPVVMKPGLARQTGGSVELSSINVSAGRYVISGGDLNAATLTIGGNGYFSSGLADAKFVQNGGQVHIETVQIAPTYFYLMTDLGAEPTNPVSDSNSAQPIFWEPGIGSGTSNHVANYEIRGGSLTAGQIYIGSGAFFENANFRQSGGDVDISRILEVFGPTNSYSISGGSLRARRIEIGDQYLYYSDDLSHGNFSILDRSARVTIAGELLLGGGSHFSAVPGATIHFTKVEPSDDWKPLTGDNVVIRSTNSDDVAGLGNLKVIFEGGMESTATLEAAGKDLGASYDSFFHNFALNTLQVGGMEPAKLSLIDLVDNQLNGEANEAVYVEHLIVRPGSLLDLGNIHLYYHTVDIGAGGSVNGAMFAVTGIPEPGTAAIACLAICGVAISVTRRRPS